LVLECLSPRSIGWRIEMKIGRNASTGRFAPVSTARKKASTYVVETIKRSGSPKPPKKR